MAPSFPERRQAGFSMVEMLVTALVMGIGLLGLTMLQVMSMKGTRGTKSVTTAVQVAERILDQVELEGRLGWLDKTNAQGVASVLNPKYVGVCSATSPVNDYFDVNGLQLTAAAGSFFQASTLDVLDTPGPAGSTGVVSDYQVTVNFVDTTNITRHVITLRRILHV